MMWRVKYTPTGTIGAPARMPSMAGPAGNVVRSPKNSTSIPPPCRSRSDSRHTISLARSARSTVAATSGPSGTTRMPSSSRTSTNQSYSSGGSRRSTTTDTR